MSFPQDILHIQKGHLRQKLVQSCRFVGDPAEHDEAVAEGPESNKNSSQGAALLVADWFSLFIHSPEPPDEDKARPPSGRS